MNPLLMVWNLEEVAVKPFAHFYNEILMVLEASGGWVNPFLVVWNLREVAVKPFIYFYIKTFMVLEASGRCCESIIDGFQSPRGCCEAICALFQ